MRPTRAEASVGAVGLGLLAARAATHAAGLDRYAALLSGGVPEGAWDVARGPTYCALVVALQLSAVAVAPVLLLAALFAWVWRRRARRPLANAPRRRREATGA